MQTFTESAPLPMRIPATTPPVAGDHIDIGVWPNGWRFMADRDAARFARLTPTERETYRSMFDRQAAALAEPAPYEWDYSLSTWANNAAKHRHESGR
jgi:hypothetical protein